MAGSSNIRRAGCPPDPDDHPQSPHHLHALHLPASNALQTRTNMRTTTAMLIIIYGLAFSALVYYCLNGGGHHNPGLQRLASHGPILWDNMHACDAYTKHQGLWGKLTRFTGPIDNKQVYEFPWWVIGRNDTKQVCLFPWRVIGRIDNKVCQSLWRVTGRIDNKVCQSLWRAINNPVWLVSLLLLRIMFKPVSLVILVLWRVIDNAVWLAKFALH